jgi:signal transduction histidine kinase
MQRIPTSSADPTARIGPPQLAWDQEMSARKSRGGDAATRVRPRAVEASTFLPVQIDLMRLEQVLVNLLDNTIKFSPRAASLLSR